MSAAKPNRADALASIERVLTRDIVFVTGKGGTGKTTLASALAVLAARRRRAASVVAFEDPGTELHAAHVGVERIVIPQNDALHELAASVFNSTIVAKVVLATNAMKRFVRASPAIVELAHLEQVRLIAEGRGASRGSGGQRKFAVVDLPASGHAVPWLRAPVTFRRFFRRGPLHDIGQRLERLLADRARVCVVVCTLPEELVLRETVELCRKLASEHGAGPELIVLNHVPPLATDGAADALRRVGRLAGDVETAGEVAGLLDRRQSELMRAVDAALSAGIDASRLALVSQRAAEPSAQALADELELGGLPVP